MRNFTIQDSTHTTVLSVRVAVCPIHRAVRRSVGSAKMARVLISWNNEKNFQLNQENCREIASISQEVS